jgi:hypothetical protein
MVRDDAVAEMFRRQDMEALVALAGTRPGGVARFLTGRLYAADEQDKWCAVRMFGVLARQRALFTDGRLADLLARFLWALNDESGTVPFGVPEAIGEIVAARPEHGARVVPILCGMLTEDDTFQTGPVEQGIYWALGRIGPVVLSHCPGVLAVVRASAREHPDLETRAAAAAALDRLDPAPSTTTGRALVF